VGTIISSGQGFDEARKELEAVLASRSFQRGPNLAKIFAYVCGKYFAGDLDSIREYNIAVEALGRKANFEPCTDSIVRVEVSRLRRRLNEYYSTEGADHRVQIRLQESGYIPQVVVRPEEKTEPAGSASQVEPLATVSDWKQRAGWCAVGFALAACLAGVWSFVAAPARTAAKPTPFLDHLWSQLFRNGHHTDIVTSDANVMFLSNFVGRPITLLEYRSAGYPRNLLEAYAGGVETQKAIARLMSTFLTTTQDAVVAAQFSENAGHYGFESTVVFARDFHSLPNADNLVLLGHSKANPNVEFFENRLNYYFAWDERNSKGMVVNRAPRSNEQANYPTEASRTYGTIAYLRNGNGDHTVLLLGGSDMAGTDLGGRFLCDEASVRQLHSILKVGASQHVPPFELLLEGRRVYNLPYEPRVVSWRVSAP
jgi:hypothetical protein